MRGRAGLQMTGSAPVRIIDYIVSNASPASPANADANADGIVDILDLVWVIDQIVGG